MAEMTVAQEKNGYIVPWPKKPKLPEGWHSLIKLRDAKVAHEVLSGCTFNKVRLCTVCQRHQKTCPHQEGEEPYGVCPSFILDEHDIVETEDRMMSFITLRSSQQLEQLAA